MDFTITLERGAVVDFLPVLVGSFIQVFIKNPTGKQNWMAFVEPLTWQAWVVILAFLKMSITKRQSSFDPFWRKASFHPK